MADLRNQGRRLRAVQGKASPAGRFPSAGPLGAPVLAALALLAACSREDRPPTDSAQAPAPTHIPPASPPSRPPQPAAAPANCDAPGFERAALANAMTLRTMPWAPFRRPELGWETYVPLVGREIGADCPAESGGFAARLAAWQAEQGLPATGRFEPASFTAMKGAWQEARPFVMISARGVCPPPPDEPDLAAAEPHESYGGKFIRLRAGALDAYRRMVAAAEAEAPEIMADPRNLTIFSGYRSPESDAARCAREGNCNGIVRSACSPHRTGLAVDVYLGAAPGYGPDSSADPNRLYQTKTAAYGWLVANAGRFGFANYPFEPWHWEWTGEDP